MPISDQIFAELEAAYALGIVEGERRAFAKMRADMFAVKMPENPCPIVTAVSAGPMGPLIEQIAR